VSRALTPLMLRIARRAAAHHPNHNAPLRRRGKVDVRERCRRVERRAARISCTVGDGAEAAVRRGPPAIAPGRRAQKWHLLRTSRRYQMKITTLKSQCFSRKKIALMGFARNERMPPFDEKPVGISVSYSCARMEITPRIANPSRTRMPMRVSNQVFD